MFVPEMFRQYRMGITLDSSTGSIEDVRLWLVGVVGVGSACDVQRSTGYRDFGEEYKLATSFGPFLVTTQVLGCTDPRSWLRTAATSILAEDTSSKWAYGVHWTPVADRHGGEPWEWHVERGKLRGAALAAVQACETAHREEV